MGLEISPSLHWKCQKLYLVSTNYKASGNPRATKFEILKECLIWLGASHFTKEIGQ